MVRSTLVAGTAFLRDGGRRLALGAILTLPLMPSTALAGRAPGPQAPQAAPAPAPPEPRTPAPAPTALTNALATVLNRAATTAPGTYTVIGTSLEPSKEPLPVLVQADALRGPEQTIRVVVSLGAQVTQPAVTRARIVAAGGTGPAILSDIEGSSPAGVIRTVNQTTLKPGAYELLAAVAQPGAGGSSLVALAKSRLVVPDLWRGTLAVSPVVLGDTVAAAPASAAGSPFAFGPTALRPSAGDRFPQGGDLHVAFRVFNWTAPPEQKPDLQVEYVFYERTPKRGVFFNKVKPQLLNAQTLGERFDAASGVVNGGMTIPLASFPFGEFQLAVRVTDKRTRQTASQETRFVVVP